MIVPIVANAQVTGKDTRTGARTVANFVEIPGEMEFTGQMLVRPQQPERLARLGMGSLQIEAMRQQAEAIVAPNTIGRLAPIDVYIVRLPNNVSEQEYSRSLMKTGLFENVTPDWRVFPLYTPNDPSLGSQWSHTNSNSREAWDVHRGSTNVIVAITDTGVHKTHEDFTIPSSRFVSGYNSVNALAEASGGQVQDINGHGTHCAGISAAWGNNSRGVAGVNLEGARIMPVRVSNSSGGGSSISWLVNGALWAAQNGARVVSTSYSGVTDVNVGNTGTTLKNTYNAVYCWAAGNASSNVSAGDHVNVTIVGATASNNARAGFSNYGLNTDVFAPGDNIFSTYWTGAATNTYASLSGTSMACPFAAGLAALIMAQNPSYTAQRVEDVLYKSSITMNDANLYGWGRVNCQNAVGRTSNSYSLFRGTLAGGNNNSLFRVDGDALDVGKGITVNASEAPIQVDTVHNSSFASNNVSEINIQSTVKVNSGGSFGGRLQIRNNNGTWENVGGVVALTTNYVKLEGNVTTNTANYINGTAITVRVQVFQTGPAAVANWRAQFDQTVVRTLRIN
jgi:hypothetical protein